MRTEYFIVIVQVLVVLSYASTEEEVFCDNLRNALKCKEEASPIICITRISIGQNGEQYCPLVSLPSSHKVDKCTKDVVKNYIFGQCNGLERECVAFNRTSEISKYCDKALKYVKLYYSCVSLRSKCETLPQMPNSKPLPTYPGVMMASKANISDQISPTKTAQTLEINEQKNSTQRPSEIPAKTASGSGYETQQNSSISLPGPTSRAANSRKKSKTCSPTTRSATKVSLTQKTSLTTPSSDGRNAGQSVFGIDLSSKFHVLIVLAFFSFSPAP